MANFVLAAAGFELYHHLTGQRTLVDSITSAQERLTQGMLGGAGSRLCQLKFDKIVIIEGSKRKNFPFENLVIEGGGAKIISAIGTVKVLEKKGILKQIKRFGGSSAGALLSTLLAVGYQTCEIDELMDQNLMKKIEDERFGRISQANNLRTSFGLHKGETLRKWLGEIIAKKMDGNAAATFKQVYEKTGKELVVTGAETNLRECFYFHVKTTGDLPVRDAVFISMSIPGYIQPTMTETQAFVDGGVFCNYPVHCFDGWYLSLDENDSFYKKWEMLGPDAFNSFHKDEIRFGGRNERTIGVIVYSQDEDEIFKKKLQKRNEDYSSRHGFQSNAPDPALLKARKLKKPKESAAKAQLERLNIAMERFRKTVAIRENFETLIAHNFGPVHIHTVFCGENRHIDIDLPHDESAFSADDARLLLGDDFDYNRYFGPLDFKKHKHVQRINLEATMSTSAYMYTNQLGLHFKAMAGFFEARVTVRDEIIPDDMKVLKDKIGEGYLKSTQEIRMGDRVYKIPEYKNVFDFILGVFGAFDIQLKRIHLKDEDFKRSIGINTQHISTLDFGMKDEDKEYLKRQGELGCLAFLDEYLHPENYHYDD